MNLLKKCRLCPRNCGIDRTSDKVGFCGATDKVKVARASLHFWEEPCISGKNGSGTVFFSNCTLKCVFCQNRKISRDGIGEEITAEKLSDTFLKLQLDGAHNINLVTPTHFVPQIIKALNHAKSKGLNIPIVYNTSGYEKASTIRLLDGYVDIYLPDFKYFSDETAKKYSSAPDYVEFAKESINEMIIQTGRPKFDEHGMMKSGTIVRHMLMPKGLFDSKKVLDYLYKTYKDDIFISIMSQYTPVGDLIDYPELQSKVDYEYYSCLVDYARQLGIKNAFIQGNDTAKESFIPDFFDKI